MKYPVVLVVPVLMLCDYCLTLVGATLNDRGYGKHMKVEHYELYPIWHSSVKRGQWFYLRYHASMGVVTSVLVVISELSTNATAWAVEMIISAVVVFFAAVVGRRLCQVLMFRYVVKNPEGLRGTVSYSHKTALKFSQYDVFVAFCPLAAMLCFTREAHIVGGLVGLAALFMSHIGWRKKYAKQKRQNASEPKEQADVRPSDD